MFLLVSVILSTGGGGAIPACIAGGIPACLATGLQGGGAIPACIAGGIPVCLAAGHGGEGPAPGGSAPVESAPGGGGVVWPSVMAFWCGLLVWWPSH